MVQKQHCIKHRSPLAFLPENCSPFSKPGIPLFSAHQANGITPGGRLGQAWKLTFRPPPRPLAPPRPTPREGTHDAIRTAEDSAPPEFQLLPLSRVLSIECTKPHHHSVLLKLAVQPPIRLGGIEYVSGRRKADQVNSIESLLRKNEVDAAQVCALLDSVSGVDELRRLGSRLPPARSVSHVCSAEIYCDCFTRVRHAIRAGTPTQTIQRELDDAFAPH